ncbi:glutathione S-transferase family protein [Shewanella sp. NIFS-20-20]|uniref:glutathione S-transferase family protein n=1 Tax=Shewanella sp. NIFS-20-20 TaxID=2853806 RepID=UPI003527E681
MGTAGFIAQPGRYHLYVSLACPWAHRTLIMRQLKGLANFMSRSVVNAIMQDDGSLRRVGGERDDAEPVEYLHQIYTKAQPNYSGRVTVPVLWDKHTQTIVSNESADIMRMFNSAFDEVGAATGDYYPDELRSQIDAINERVYHQVNNGVYKAGFTKTQASYDQAVTEVFCGLDWLESLLANQRYLLGANITEADWRLFTTLVRFDAVYVGHFKCNQRRIADYPALSGYLRELYQIPGISETVDFAYTKLHYYRSHTMINPSGIIPAGPELDFYQAHGRDSL